MTEEAKEKGFLGFGSLSEEKAYLMNVLTLAYLGDAVQSVYVRARLCSETQIGKPNAAHRSASGVVNARSQALLYDRIEGLLSERELSVMKRARNAKNMQSAKHATASEYHRATGVEALMGYLYLSGQRTRLELILNVGMECEE